MPRYIQSTACWGLLARSKGWATKRLPRVQGLPLLVEARRRSSKSLHKISSVRRKHVLSNPDAVPIPPRTHAHAQQILTQTHSSMLRRSRTSRRPNSPGWYTRALLFLCIAQHSLSHADAAGAFHSTSATPPKTRVVASPGIATEAIRSSPHTGPSSAKPIGDTAANGGLGPMHPSPSNPTPLISRVVKRSFVPRSPVRGIHPHGNISPTPPRSRRKISPKPHLVDPHAHVILCAVDSHTGRGMPEDSLRRSSIPG